MAAGCRRPSGYSKAVRAQRWLRDLSRGGIRRTFDATDLASIVEVFGTPRCTGRGRASALRRPRSAHPCCNPAGTWAAKALGVRSDRGGRDRGHHPSVGRGDDGHPPARPTTLRSSKRSRISRVVIVRRWSRRPTPPGRQLSTTQVLRPPPCRTARAELPQIRSGRPRFSRRWPPRPR
jgi:hypothetical protein